MVDVSRSELACPVCGQHTLALDEPPRIDVMGIQPYSDMLGMGDLPAAILPAIVCLSCGTRWRDREAFDRGEPEPPDEEPDGPAWESEDPDGPDEPAAA
jgi:C4-type Zn-finger protein